MKPIQVLVTSLTLSLASLSAQAGYTTLDLSTLVDSDLSGYTNGTSYPGPGAISIGGIPFDLTAGTNGNTWVVGGTASIGTPKSYAITGLNVANITSMYAIINSAFGLCGTSVGAIGASTGASSVSFGLVEGTNVRDHFNSVFCNTATDIVATANYGNGVRFDVYQFDLTGLTSNGANPISGLDFSTFRDAQHAKIFHPRATRFEL